MYWPKFSEKKFARKVGTGDGIKSGIACAYVRWTKYAGLKIYKTRQERDGAMRRQQRAAEHRLGPRVGHKVEFTTVAGWQSYGSAPSFKRQKFYCFFTEHVNRGRKPTYNQIRKLDEAMQQIGLFHDDLHFNNVARKGKKIICIDFGREGCYLGKPRKTANSNRKRRLCPTCGMTM